MVAGQNVGSAALGGLLMVGLQSDGSWERDGFKVIVLSVVCALSYLMAYRGLASPDTESGIASLDRRNR